MDNYKVQCKLGEGTYSEVFLATSKLDSLKYALKVMKQKYVSLDKIKKDKEIKALKMLSHPSIIKLIDVLYDPQEEKMALVFELMDCNLYEHYKSKKNAINLEKIRAYCHEILDATAYMHEKGLFHRDLKPENILVTGDRCVKIADLGSCKHAFSSRPFTEYISTRWYRAPECLLTDGHYSEKMDIWSIGCILFELYTHYPLFPGKNEADQIATIFNVLGTPHEKLLYDFARVATHLKYDFQPVQGVGLDNLLPDAPAEFMDLLKKMLQVDPHRRIDAKDALSHPFFYSLTELKKYRKALITKLTVESREAVLLLPSLKPIRKA